MTSIREGYDMIHLLSAVYFDGQYDPRTEQYISDHSEI